MGTPHATKMWVATVDERGKDLGDGRWVDIPKPDRFSANGFAYIESYVSRLLRSSASFISLIIAVPDQQIAVSLLRRGGIPELVLSLIFSAEWPSGAERERSARKFLAEQGLSTSHDYLAGNGGSPNATRCLGCFLPADTQFITRLTKDLLQRIYALREQDALDFTYQRHNNTS